MIRDTHTTEPQPKEATPLMSEAVLKTFVDVLEANERRLGTIKELTEGLDAVMKASRATGKKASITLKIEVSPDKNDELALTMQADVKTSIPTPERRKALIYHDAESHTFSKTDPRQLELLAEQEAERAEREAELAEKGIAQIGRGPVASIAGGV